jgi:hypothetical protein
MSNAKTNHMQNNNETFPGTPDPDPKKSKPKDIEAESEGTEVVNAQSQSQVTNCSETPATETDEPPISEEEKVVKINNLRDALNSDNMPLPEDERDNDIVN